MADVTRGFGRRRLAAFVAILALFVQGLAPVVHFALGAQIVAFGHQAPAGAHAHQHGGESDNSGSNSHGPCHFCRIVGAALPPPPVAELLRLEPTRIVFAHIVAGPPPATWSSRAHGARAPPTSPDRLPKIAIV